MNDGDTTTAKLTELLKHPDDLDKIGALKSDFTRKKAAVDGQLKIGLAEQLQLTQAGMTSLADGQHITNTIKEEMMKIDRLCAEAQMFIARFPEINAVALAHRNFAQVESMKSAIEGFPEKLEELNRMLREDDEDLGNQPNLLKIHHGLTKLRNIRDEAMEQIRRADDASLEATLQDYMKGLDDAIDDFDAHVGSVCMALIPLIQEGNSSLVVRLAVVIEEEEKFDNRVRELQQAQKDFKDLASRFKSLATGLKELRGYKEKFLEAIRMYCQNQIDEADAAFLEDPDKLEKSLRWYFNDLNTVKLGMVSLMPKKWHIFGTYVHTYHTALHDWLKAKADSKDSTPPQMLAIVHYKEKYYAKMQKLGAPMKELDPLLPGGRDSDLVREYRQLIIDKVEQWMTQINKTDRQNFLDRKESALDRDENGCFRTLTLGDIWRMLREQLIVASQAELTDVAEGVVDGMFRVLKARLDMWIVLVNDELSRYSKPNADIEGMQGLQDWLIALANDQIACVRDNQEDGQDRPGYLTSFQRDYESLVSPEYANAADSRIDQIKGAMTDLSVRCFEVFALLMFAVDFRAAMPEFFTPTWQSGSSRMPQIVKTYEDYLDDYGHTVPPELKDILVEELAKRLLAAYLGCVHNKSAKFRRTDPFNERMRGDVLTVFKFFERYPVSYDAIRDQWRAVDGFLKLLECEKHTLRGEFGSFIETWWDVKMSWIEAVLRCRDDFDFGALGDGKTIMKGLRQVAVETRIEQGLATVMGEVD